MLNLDKELQQYRYEHIEKYRLETINLVKERRNKIIEEIGRCSSGPNNNNSTQYRTSSSPSPFDMENRIDGIIENEKKAIEKIKQRQKNEIQTLIESEVRGELIRSKSELKEKKLKEKEEKIKEELQLRAMKEEEKRKEKEIKRQNELNKRIEENERRNKLKYEAEQKRLNDYKEMQMKNNT